MSQESFDIVDENNIPTGEVKSRDEVHSKKKDWHRTVHIWIINDQGEFLCQQRSWKKDGNPGMWQSFFWGHVKAGQTSEECVREELLEEIGIDINKIMKKPFFTHTGRSESSKHFGNTYVLKWSGDIKDIVFNDGEVEQVVWMDLNTLQSKIETGEFCNRIDSKVLEYIVSLQLSPKHPGKDSKVPTETPNKTRKEIQDAIRQEKALAKAVRKAGFRKKTEKRLAEKAERKIIHKTENAKRKLEKKIQTKNVGWKKKGT